ncbi:hypothetical protein L2E82_05909 [Cichorium intybus]|uniref:Uncharacterized protein n=1 Tax=Cichorium intybus TaxID=13427 RepID=A0ACB9H9Q7_CICIN|nr:hypothetical protein L2E82_05909 [Cichorium intybus]
MTTKIKNGRGISCNCKKSKCVQLYCDCFGASFYCGEDCSCENCLNRNDYEDTVELARRKRKLRDPYAFVPKIHRVEGGNQLMPIAGKHRKGCTCKSSMCYQNYCECYKANVGCTSECRCKDCQNNYGIKGEHNVYNPTHIMRAINEKPNDCKKVLDSTRFELSQRQSGYLQDSTPRTALQYTDHRNYTSTTRLYTPSTSTNTDMIGTSRREFDNVPLDPKSYIDDDQIWNNQFTPEEINEMLDWNPCDPSIPSSTGSASTPDDK